MIEKILDAGIVDGIDATAPKGVCIQIVKSMFPNGSAQNYTCVSWLPAWLKLQNYEKNCQFFLVRASQSLL